MIAPNTNEINDFALVVPSPEKAGVGGSIPSLAIPFKDLQTTLFEFGCIWLHLSHTYTASFNASLTNAVSLRTALRCDSGTTC